MTGTTEYEGCTFVFHVSGKGDPVVFIQGVGLPGAGWQPQTAELSREWTCLTFDNRGMAASQPAGRQITLPQMATDTLAIMDAAGLDSAHLVGHSLGGCVAQQVALAHPQRVRSLSLLCTSARGADAFRLSPRMVWLGIRSRVGTRRMRRRGFAAIIFSPAYLAANDVDQTAIRLMPIFGHDLADTPPIVSHQLRALKKFDAVSRIAGLSSIPTLVVSAAADPIFPPRCGRMLADGIRGAHFVGISDASHGVVIEQAAKINALLARHIGTASENAARPAVAGD